MCANPVLSKNEAWNKADSADWTVDYLLVVLASLLVGVVLRWGVGILEGLPPCWREAERGVGRPESVTVSDMSEQTDWMSEISKSEASLPRRLLPRLPALLPGLLGILPNPEKRIHSQLLLRTMILKST